MEVTLPRMSIYDSSLAAPLYSSELTDMTINAIDYILVKNSTLINIARNLILNWRSLYLLEDSVVQHTLYYSSLWLNIYQNLNISGMIQQNNITVVMSADNHVNDNPTTSTELAKPNDLHEDQFLLYFGTKSKVRADRIMVFSDHKITLLGRLENVVENTEGKTTIIGACTLMKDVKHDVFRCFPPSTNETVLTNDLVLEQYNSQYGTSLDDVQDVFDQMPQNYSVYIHSLDKIELNGTVVGNRIGLWATEIVVGGVVNATEAGCLPKQGDGGGIDVKCCNHAGGSFGGIGIAGTPNTDDPECIGATPNCTEGVAPSYGSANSTAFQGSGGAGLQGGKGGGIIWVHALGRFSLNGTLEARGSDSETTEGASSGAGGGSGGAISVTTSTIAGTADSVINVSGGDGKQGGGGGAGGWIYGNVLHSTSPNFAASASKDWHGRFNLYPGQVNNNLEDITLHMGQLALPQCLPGYESVF